MRSGGRRRASYRILLQSCSGAKGSRRSQSQPPTGTPSPMKRVPRAETARVKNPAGGHACHFLSFLFLAPRQCLLAVQSQPQDRASSDFRRIGSMACTSRRVTSDHSRLRRGGAGFSLPAFVPAGAAYAASFAISERRSDLSIGQDKERRCSSAPVRTALDLKRQARARWLVDTSRNDRVGSELRVARMASFDSMPAARGDLPRRVGCATSGHWRSAARLRVESARHWCWDWISVGRFPELASARPMKFLYLRPELS